MEQSDNALLREIHKLTKENNKMLHKLERDAKRSRFWKTLKIVVMGALLFGAYYLVQPLIENLTNAYTSIQNSFEEIQNTRESASNINSFLSGLKKEEQ